MSHIRILRQDEARDVLVHAWACLNPVCGNHPVRSVDIVPQQVLALVMARCATNRPEVSTGILVCLYLLPGSASAAQPHMNAYSSHHQREQGVVTPPSWQSALAAHLVDVHRAAIEAAVADYHQSSVRSDFPVTAFQTLDIDVLAAHAWPHWQWIPPPLRAAASADLYSYVHAGWLRGVRQPLLASCAAWQPWFGALLESQRMMHIPHVLRASCDQADCVAGAGGHVLQVQVRHSEEDTHNSRVCLWTMAQLNELAATVLGKLTLPPGANGNRADWGTLKTSDCTAVACWLAETGLLNVRGPTTFCVGSPVARIVGWMVVDHTCDAAERLVILEPERHFFVVDWKPARTLVDLERDRHDAARAWHLYHQQRLRADENQRQLHVAEKELEQARNHVKRASSMLAHLTAELLHGPASAPTLAHPTAGAAEPKTREMYLESDAEARDEQKQKQDFNTNAAVSLASAAALDGGGCSAPADTLLAWNDRVRQAQAALQTCGKYLEKLQAERIASRRATEVAEMASFAATQRVHRGRSFRLDLT